VETQTETTTVNPHPDSPAEPQNSSALFLMLLVWRNRRRLLQWTAVGMLCSIVLAFVLPAHYQSRASLMPPDSQSLSGSSLIAAMASSAGPAGTSGLASTLLGAKSSTAVFVGLLKSSTAQDDLINRFDLRRVYHDKRYEDARKDLAQNTSINDDQKTGIITVVVTDKDPNRARDIAAAYVDELNALTNRLSTSSARRERIFLEERLQAIKQDLDASTASLSQFSSRNGMVDQQSQGRSMMDAAIKLKGELIASESDLRGLQSIYAPDNVRVRSAQARVGELRSELQKLGGTGESDDASSSQMYPSIRKLPLLGVTYANLYREVKIQETVYEALTRQYEVSKVEEAKSIPTVRVLDQPLVPERRSSPHRLSVIALGTLFVFLLCVFVLYVQDWWQKIDSSDPRRSLVADIVSSWPLKARHRSA